MNKNLKLEIFKNEKLSFYMNKFKFLNFNYIEINKYHFIYDFDQKIFLSNNIQSYIPKNQFNLLYFELKHTNHYILVIFDNKFYNLLKQPFCDLWLLYNIYGTHYYGSKQLIPFFNIEKKIQSLNKDIFRVHWIWFRKNNFKLNNIVIQRALTWIYNNSDFIFTLWTNINNQNELDDFFSEIDTKILDIFLSKVSIKFNSETINVVYSFYKKYLITIPNLNILIDMFNRNNTSDIIYKTDYLRYILIYNYGGIYIDFNDCICLHPIKYLLSFHENELIFGRDSNDSYNNMDFNNYFIFSKKNNTSLISYIIKSITLLPELYKFISDIKLIDFQIKSFLNILNNLYNHNNITYTSYMKRYLEIFLSIIFTSIELKDSIIQYIKTTNIFYNLTIKYLEYINKFYNTKDIVYALKNNLEYNDFDINEIKNIIDEKRKNNFDDFLIINTSIFLNIIISIINIPHFCKNYLKNDVNTIDNCYLLKHMSFLSFIGHLYDNTCYGNNKIYNELDIELADLL